MVAWYTVRSAQLVPRRNCRIMNRIELSMLIAASTCVNQNLSSHYRNIFSKTTLRAWKLRWSFLYGNLSDSVNMKSVHFTDLTSPLLISTHLTSNCPKGFWVCIVANDLQVQYNALNVRSRMHHLKGTSELHIRRKKSLLHKRPVKRVVNLLNSMFYF